MRIGTDRAAEILNSRDNILILMHASPDGDTVGSAHALYYALLSLDKSCAVLCADEIDKKYGYITENARKISDAPFEAEYIVSADVADEKLLGGALEEYKGRIGLAIDHHKSNKSFADNLCLDENASSTCEVMCEIIEKLGAEITPLIADCLYTGIITDTGCFKYPSAGAKTHICASRLINAGADYAKINRVMFDVKSKARIMVEQAVLNDMRFFFGGAAAAITLDRETIERAGASEGDLDGISAIPRTVEGVEVGVMFREKSDGVYKVSVRTTEYVDASKLCAKFGGGGHARAAGCVISGGKQEVINRFMEKVEGLL